MEEKMVTQGYLVRNFGYDKENGALFHRKKGIDQKNIKDRVISIKNKLYSVRKLIWLYHHGYYPEKKIHNIYCDSQDDRIEFLTDNAAKIVKGEYGLTFNKQSGKWSVRVETPYKNVFIGNYITKHEARIAFSEAYEMYVHNVEPPHCKYCTITKCIYRTKFDIEFEMPFVSIEELKKHCRNEKSTLTINQ